MPYRSCQDGDSETTGSATQEGKTARLTLIASLRQWFPVKEMGLTIRLAELADFAEGIGKAVELAIESPQIPAQAQVPPSRSIPPGKEPVAPRPKKTPQLKPSLTTT